MDARDAWAVLCARAADGTMVHTRLVAGFEQLGMHGLSALHAQRAEAELAELCRRSALSSRRSGWSCTAAPTHPDPLPSSLIDRPCYALRETESRDALKALVEAWVAWEEETVAAMRALENDLMGDAAVAFEAEAAREAAACAARELEDAIEAASKMEGVRWDLAAVSDMQGTFARRARKARRAREDGGRDARR